MLLRGAGSHLLVLCSSTIFLNKTKKFPSPPRPRIPITHLVLNTFSDLTLCKHSVVLQALKGNLVLEGLKAHVKLKTALGINIKN